MRRPFAVVIFLVLLLTAMAAAADVRNVSLATIGDSGVMGRATTLMGNVTGMRPYGNLEVNVRMDKLPAENSVYEFWLVDTQSNYNLSLGVAPGMTFTQQIRMAGMPYDAIAVSVEPAGDMDPRPCTIVAQGSLPGMMVSSADFGTMAIVPEDEIFQRQLITQRYNLTASQIADLRMRGWTYSDIALAANIAQRSNRNVNDVVAMIEQGRTWDDVARSYNLSSAMIYDPWSMQAASPGSVGVMAGVGAAGTGMSGAPMFYLRYPSGRAVLSWNDWQKYSKAGNSWRDVAVAANIAAITGEDVGDLLWASRIRGGTWQSMAMERGLVVNDVMDVSAWPFGETADRNLMTTPSTQGASGMGTYGGSQSTGTQGTMQNDSGSLSTPGSTGTQGGTGTDSCAPATGSGY